MFKKAFKYILSFKSICGIVKFLEAYVVSVTF